MILRVSNELLLVVVVLMLVMIGNELDNGW